MKAIFLLAASLLMFGAASCDSGSDPLGLRIDTIFVIDTSAYRLMTGRVEMYSNCKTPTSAAGIKIEIPELRLSLLTDDSGRYSFKTSNIQRDYVMTLSRAGAYTYVPQNSYARYSADSGRYLFDNFRMYEYFDYAGEIDSHRFVRQFYPGYKDSTYTDSNGIVKTVTVPGDSIDYSIHYFRVAGLNEMGRRSPDVRPVLIFSKTPSIDPLDPSTYLGLQYTDHKDVEYYELPIHNLSLESYGLKKGDRFYVAATGIGACAPIGITGRRISPVREVIIP